MSYWKLFNRLKSAQSFNKSRNIYWINTQNVMSRFNIFQAFINFCRQYYFHFKLLSPISTHYEWLIPQIQICLNFSKIGSSIVTPQSPSLNRLSLEILSSFRKSLVHNCSQTSEARIYPPHPQYTCCIPGKKSMEMPENVASHRFWICNFIFLTTPYAQSRSSVVQAQPCCEGPLATRWSQICANCCISSRVSFPILFPLLNFTVLKVSSLLNHSTTYEPS